MNIQPLVWKSAPAELKNKILRRSEEDISSVAADVAGIIAQVRDRGDDALREFSLKFDKADLYHRPLRVSEEEFSQAEARLTPEVKAALDYAIANVQKYHRTQVKHDSPYVEVRPGLLAGERTTPVDSVALYVPRGRGSFPSMAYMLAVPAALAGVPRIVMVSPPDPDGSLDPACLYAARKCGVHEVYRVGGAQAIAALTYGTPSIAPVLKITGPGSMFVTAAKRQVSSLVDIGLPAGPSESAVLAEEGVDPWKVALDLLVEAEHGSDSCALLVTPSATLAEQVGRYILKEIETLEEPRRTFVKNVFSGYGAIVVVDSLEEGAQLINDFAPEHLSLQTRDPWHTLSLIRNAGEILLGQDLPFSAANYVTGPNAVLPTGGKAKTFGPVSVRDFQKSSSVVFASPRGYADFAGPVTTLADYEGFVTHANALKKRQEGPGV